MTVSKAIFPLAFILLVLGLSGCDFIDDLFFDETPSSGASSGADDTDRGDEPADDSERAPERVLKGAMPGFYKYTDNKGVVHYVDKLAKVPAKYRKRAHHPSGGVVNIHPSSNIDELLDKHDIDAKKYGSKKGGSKTASRKHGDVIVYSTPWCGYCKKATAYLRQKGVAFTEKNVQRDRAALKEMLAKSGGARGVPVIDVHGTILRGFSSQAIEQALR